MSKHTIVDEFNDSAYEECSFCSERCKRAYMTTVEDFYHHTYYICKECSRNLSMDDKDNSLSTDAVNDILSTIDDELRRCWKKNIIGTEMLDEYGQGLNFAKTLISQYLR